jgi:hypothetical protein
LERVHGRKDLNGGPELGKLSDAHPADVQHDAVEVEEDTFTEFDVPSVIAVEGRLQPDGVPTFAKDLLQESTPDIALRFARRVKCLAEITGTIATGDKLRVESVIKLPGKHFFAFSSQSLSLQSAQLWVVRNAGGSFTIPLKWRASRLLNGKEEGRAFIPVRLNPDLSFVPFYDSLANRQPDAAAGTLRPVKPFKGFEDEGLVFGRNAEAIVLTGEPPGRAFVVGRNMYSRGFLTAVTNCVANQVLEDLDEAGCIDG